jgi:shikimate kinase
MRIFLVGVSCVGKTAIGADLAKLLDCSFFDFDEEVERFFGMPIEHLQERFENMELFRQEASKALLHVLTRKESKNSVIVLPPSGLMNFYWKVISESTGTIIALKDDALNILKRIEFFDKDSILITKIVSDREKKYYLSEIQKDIIYYNHSYERANISVSIEGLNVRQAATKVKEQLQMRPVKEYANKSLQPTR